ncbi:MAG: hypothetical protein QOC63_1986 [Mycobacterium sp.]|nr:hypothetical protein [Mycobacterium sp.]
MSSGDRTEAPTGDDVVDTSPTARSARGSTWVRGCRTLRTNTALLDNQGDQVDAGPARDIKTFTVDHDLATYPFYLALPPLPSGRHDVDITETRPQSNEVG